MGGGTLILTHAYSGAAFPAYPAEWKSDGYVHEPETELIGGAFRVVEDEGSLVVIGNGEHPEKFWKVDYDEWHAGAEDHTPESPPFVEAISNPIIRAGLRQQVVEGRRLARRCGEGKPPTREVDE